MKTIANVPVTRNAEMAFHAVLTLSGSIVKVELEKIVGGELRRVFEGALESSRQIISDILARISCRVRNIRLESRTGGDVIVVCYL